MEASHRDSQTRQPSLSWLSCFVLLAALMSGCSPAANPSAAEKQGIHLSS